MEILVLPLNPCKDLIKSSKTEEDILKMTTPFAVYFESKIYRMKCKECGRWGNAHIQGSSVDFLCDRLCIQVEQIMKEGKQKHHKLDKMLSKDYQSHNYKICEACQLEKCEVSKLKMKAELRNLS